ncbi:MAG: DUF4870 domain-containing protein [Candidatus Omnitrophica bacterium]|nr:DUF4870 domain-containing protein [Candidatus Omnitrophota bacterium]
METKDLGKTSIGLDANIAALVAYALLFISGIVIFALEKDNKFVRFHALQSSIVFGALFVLSIIVSRIPLINILSPIIGVVTLILWIILMIKAYQGEKFKLPIAGDIAEQKS